jgi:glucosamine--fructose-6-phosphate aminotransferase (isomerizing)
MKHGPIALIDEKMPVVVVMPAREPHYEKTLSQPAGGEGARGSGLASPREGDARSADRRPRLRSRSATRSSHPIVTSLPLQLLAYYVADFKGTDVDQPRNLAKSVTVESDHAAARQGG